MPYSATSNPAISSVVKVLPSSFFQRNAAVELSDMSLLKFICSIPSPATMCSPHISRRMNPFLIFIAALFVYSAKVSQILVKGDKYVPNVADLSYWAWPTSKPYTITSGYGYRWGEFHDAIDIYVGYGSPIYAANNGTVYKAGTGCRAGNLSCNGRQGNYIIIDHNISGYYTVYMHLKDIYVKEGQTVERGQKIGTMGNTGNVYPVPTSSSPYRGTHLHFTVRKGAPYGSHINPMRLY